MTPETSYYRSPLGWLALRTEGDRLAGLDFVSKRPIGGALLSEKSVFYGELKEYFSGRRKRFSFRTRLQGTPFQNRVWKELASLPYGRTVSYSEVASRIGKKKAVRAVASAVGSNPAALVVPCHRVIGADGSLTGYAYGLKKKAWLLRHERALA